MKLFNSIQKKWLQHRISKYSFKSQDALSKSEHLLKLSNHYESLAQGNRKMFGSGNEWEERDYKLSSKYAIKSSHYKHLSDFYLNKQIILEKQLCSLLGNNVVAFRKIRKV